MDAEGLSTVYNYNGIGQETSEDWYNAVDANRNPVGSVTETLSFVYNAAGLWPRPKTRASRPPRPPSTATAMTPRAA